MSRDYLTNLTFGITFLNLAIVGVAALTFNCTFFTIVRFGAIICNIGMGVLLIFNRKSVSKNTPMYKPYWLGMIICNIAIVKLIDIECYIVNIASLVYLIGFIIVIISIFSIGGSFAVTPMESPIKTKFAYSFVRHPMYLGESLMLLSCVFTTTKFIILAFGLFLLHLLFTIKRILEEELLLTNVDDYKKYCKNTPWRLLPFVW